MRYCVIVKVPGTDHLRYEADRLVSYVDSSGATINTAGLPFSEEERAAAVSVADATWPLVSAIKDLKNAFLPPGADAMRAHIEVFPLYDSANAIVDTLVNMEDAALEVVPVVAIENAPGLTAGQRSTAYQRLAQIAVDRLPAPVKSAVSVVVSGG